MLKKLKRDLETWSVSDLEELEKYIDQGKLKSDIQEGIKEKKSFNSLEIKVGDCFISKSSMSILRVSGVSSDSSSCTCDVITVYEDVCYEEDHYHTKLAILKYYSPFPRERFSEILDIYEETGNRADDLWKECGNRIRKIIDNGEVR